MRICILGDSHTAALKNGWSEISANHPGVSLTFYAARGNTLDGIEADGHDLVAGNERLRRSLEYTSGGEARVKTSEYDAFLVCGLFFMPLWKRPGLSRAVISAGNADRFHSSLSATAAGLGRAATAVPIYIMPRPLVAIRPDPAVAPDVPPYEEQIDQLTRDSTVRNFRFLGQPPETIAGSWWSKPEFASGSMRLGVDPKLDGEMHPDGEADHMNAAFGSIFLLQFLRLVK